MAQISKTQAGKASDNVAELSQRMTDQTADAVGVRVAKTQDAARSGVTEMQKSTAATLETGRAMAGRTAQDTKEFGQALSQLLSEQAQHNLEVFTKLTGTFNLSEAAQIQADFLHASMERSAQFARRYLETAQATMFSAMTRTQVDLSPLSRR
ncbi:MAG TPA: hypothetical protein VNS22_23565 [Geminicoccus sp.]|uniref:hypothetical protein n=1 Tax=Geminicoccus sp. TaxID=2024832 RepID=UPI002D10AB26|nr:hypothetical protein [Geminicoccus sp.]HWL71334.1 hypothetical protein [Geminicoccus sp.]